MKSYEKKKKYYERNVYTTIEIIRNRDDRNDNKDWEIHY